MRLLHLTFGLFIVVVFLLTGLYMHFHLHHMAGVPDALRLLYRTRHIFILLAGLLNLVLAAYLVDRSGRSRRVFQWLRSVLIIISPLLFCCAFLYYFSRADLC